MLRSSEGTKRQTPFTSRLRFRSVMRTLWVWDRAHLALRSLWSEVHSHLVRALPGQISCPLQRHRFSRATRQVQGCSSLYNSQLILQALALVVRSVLVRRASDSHHHLQLVVQRARTTMAATCTCTQRCTTSLARQRRLIEPAAMAPTPCCAVSAP